VPELAILLVVVLVLFGGSKLPQLARNLGQAQQEFKKGLGDGQKAAPEAATPEPTEAASPDAAASSTLPPPSASSQSGIGPSIG
jgi:sec-independent protein translocase protein TatA